MGAPNLALWWIPAGALPTLDEAQQTLNGLEQNGPAAEAFTFADVFDVNGKAITLPPIQALCA